jgi:four helix bundle protein
MEGGARKNDGEKKHFVGIARGSAAEIAYQVMLAKDLGFIDSETANLLSEKIGRVRQMLSGLLKTGADVRD